MISNIINGLGVTEVLNPEITAFGERSGSSTSSRSTTATDSSVYTLPDNKQYTLTKAQFDDFNKVYNEAYGYAYSKNINQPQVKDVLKYGQIVADWYKDGKVFTEANYLASQTQTYSVALPNGQIASNLTQAQYDTVKALLDIYNEAFALSKAYELPVPSWDTYDTMSNAQNALAKLKAQIQAAQEAAASEAAAQKAAAEAAKKAAVEMIDGHTYWENKSKIEARIAEKYATTPPEVVLPDNMPTVQPQEEKKGSGILVPALLFAVGALAAIVLVKSKPKRR